MAGVILAIGVLVFLAHFFIALFHWRRIPDVLLLMLIGVFLGPVQHWVKPEDFGGVGRVASTVALIVILFESGIALDPHVFASAIRPSLWLTLPTFFATAVGAGLVTVYALGVPPLTGAMAGAILGGVSSAVVIPMVKSLKLREPLSTTLVMESALGDVLSIVILLGLLESAALGGLRPWKMAGDIISSLVMAAMVGGLGGILWILVLNKVRQFPNTAFTTLATVFIVYGVADELGFSGAIAALAFGAMLANYELLGLRRLKLFQGLDLGRIEQTDVDFFMEILFLLKTFFFVYLGLSIRFENIGLAGWALVLGAAAFIARVAIVRMALYRENVSWHDLAITTAMTPKGLVAAVLAGIPVAAKVEGALAVQNFTYMVIVLSICWTALVVVLSDKEPAARLFRAVYGNKQVALAAEQSKLH
jgi:potassium/hydrogen antiporter